MKLFMKGQGPKKSPSPRIIIITKDCSSPATFQRKLQSLKTWFCKRGYPHKIVDSQIKRVSEKSLDELFEGLDEKETGVPLVVTNHSRFHNLSAILRKIF